jgi:hypothetical protein
MAAETRAGGGGAGDAREGGEDEGDEGDGRDRVRVRIADARSATAHDRRDQRRALSLRSLLRSAP